MYSRKNNWADFKNIFTIRKLGTLVVNTMAKNWISSPLGIHFLLHLHGQRAGKCFNIFDRANEYAKFEFQTKKYNIPDDKAFLTNICMYKGAWKSPMVKVHNSFSYTEDIKYEVRILEVCSCDDDVSFAIVVPNETDVLCHLVQKLHEEGLSAAVATIQPAFTATCRQNLPTFKFKSNIDIRDQQDTKITQSGCVTVNQSGIDIKVLTCLLLGKETKIHNFPRLSNVHSNCFSFALVCNDVPIFTGQVIP
ncbi:PREDICTED: serpin B4-like isoform X4 [Papilio polytes]|uniref:serpin B4-like isoform X4 n=1 Tax=Papilio polytes TaxID=76194 RepID=UPI00067633B6|nr:PREDICTED: serpin B4-like isoform X4 [Papilio polytes]